MKYRISGRKPEGEDVEFRFAPVGKNNQLLFLGDVISWDLHVYDRTKRTAPPGTGTIMINTIPLQGQWVSLNDGVNAVITYEWVPTAGHAATHPYLARPIVINVLSTNLCRAALWKAINLDIAAGKLDMVATALSGNGLTLTHSGGVSVADKPIKKAGSSMVVTGMSPGNHLQLLEQSPTGIMFATAQTSVQDSGWDDALGGYTFRYDFLNALAPLQGGRVYDFEFRLRTRNDGYRMMIARVHVLSNDTPT